MAKPRLSRMARAFLTASLAFLQIRDRRTPWQPNIRPPPSGGSFAALLVNIAETPQRLTFALSELLGRSGGSSASAGQQFKVRDMWRHSDLGSHGVTESLEFASVGAHDCVMLRFDPVTEVAASVPR